MIDPLIKNSLSDYTEHEFIRFLEALFKADVSPSEARADALLFHFRNIIGHPSGADLIYHPEPGADTSAQGITRTVKEWRKANGLPGFKPGC
ncbi:bacteriocin immunity protein [Pseudomonas sp. ICMP 460]|uniref:bacteriocin immunity protein n=1 Tax=Pseudomonas sp. ICMP 460 TaxID=1718917 RepID=UPI000C082472|nr:bacteriocin immunity protein [Pseudomonas sp. ICMP 460]PHN31427.1 colicin transporter [Pseudomonas sp. ICMP 460]